MIATAILLPNSPIRQLCSEIAFFGTPFSLRQHAVHASMVTCGLVGGSFGPDGLLRTSGTGRTELLAGRSPPWPGSDRDMATQVAES